MVLSLHDDYAGNATCHGTINHILHEPQLVAKREAVDAKSWDRDGSEAAAIIPAPAGIGGRYFRAGVTAAANSVQASRPGWRILWLFPRDGCTLTNMSKDDALSVLRGRDSRRALA